MNYTSAARGLPEAVVSSAYPQVPLTHKHGERYSSTIRYNNKAVGIWRRGRTERSVKAGSGEDA